MCGAYCSNRSFALQQSCPGKCPSDTRLQLLRQLVLGRHPITGSLLLEEMPQPISNSGVGVFPLLCSRVHFLFVLASCVRTERAAVSRRLQRRIRHNGMLCCDETGTLTQNIMTIVRVEATVVRDFGVQLFVRSVGYG